MERTVFLVYSVDLNPVIVPAGAQEPFPVRGDSEIAWMLPGGLKASAVYLACVWFDGEYGNPITFEPMAGIEETSVGREVYVRAAMTLSIVSCECLDGKELTVIVGEDHQFVSELAQKVCKSAISAEDHVPGAEFYQPTVLPCYGRVPERMDSLSLDKAMDAIHAEIGHKEVLPVGGGHGTVHVSGFIT